LLLPRGANGRPGLEISSSSGTPTADFPSPK